MKFTNTIKPVYLTSDPTGTASGEFYYNSASSRWRGYNGSSWIDINSPSATIASSAIFSTSAVVSGSVDWAGVINKPTTIASATISGSAIISSSAIVSSSADVASSVDWSNVTNQPLSIASATVSASVDWSGVSNKPTSIASATISSSAVVAAQVDWSGVTNKPSTIASATVAASVDWSGISNQPTSIASATISSSALVSNSSIISSSATVASSATISIHSNTASSVDWSNITNKPTSIASATISSSAIIAASALVAINGGATGSVNFANVSTSATISSSAIISSSADWNGISNKPTSIASATISSSAIISSSALVSSSAVIATHANTASSIAGNLVTGTVASSTISSSTVISSSALVSNTSTSATISSSATISASAIVAASSTWSSSTNFALTSQNVITTSSGLMIVDHIDFSASPASTASTGRLQWTAGEGTLTFGLSGGNVNLNIGQEEVALCYNGTGSALTAGTVVYINGAQGQRPSIAKAFNSGEATSSKVLGVVSETIANGAEGFVTTFGILRNVNTSLYAPGTALWLSSSAGLFTSTKSYAPNHLVFIGYSIKQSSTAGQIFVNPQNGYELYELHNVSASNPNNNDVIYYNTSASLWQTASVQSLITNLSNIDYIDFDITPTASNTVGRMNWDATAGTVAVTMDNGATLTTALVGQNQFIKATNKDAVNMVKGDVVYIYGAIGNRVAVRLASASANGIDKSPIGMCAEDISINSSGFIVISGTLSGINTQAYTEGDAVWLSASPGKITNTRPPAPLHANVIGHVINSNIATGTINVGVVDGQKLSFLNDVVLTASTFTNNDILAYNLSASYWENTSIQNKITTASVGYANVSASSTISSSATTSSSANVARTSTSATLSSSAIISSSADWNGISNKPTSIASATISSSAIVSASVDWVGVSNKPTSIASATISSSAIISSSAMIATHANTASSIAGSLVVGTVASATVSASLSSSPSLSGVVTLNGVRALSTSLDTKTNNYTLSAGDGGNTILMNVSSANLVIIPASATINFPIGTRVDVVQIGASATTASRASTDVTLNFYSPSGSANPTIRARYGAISLIKYDVNTWIAIGNIV